MFTTHPALLAGVKKGDDVSWNQFRDTYRPLIFHCAEQSGLSKYDYLELEQNVLVTFFKACENFEYDPGKGRFRTYFGSLIRNCIIQQQQNDRKSQSKQLSATEAEIFTENKFEEYWEKEWKLHIFWLAMQKAKKELPPKMIRVFELCDLEGVSPYTVAASSGICLATFYNYRKKVLTELRRNVDELKKQEDTTDETLQ